MAQILIIDILDQLKDENKRLIEEKESIVDLLNKFKKLLTIVMEMCFCSKQQIFRSLINAFEIDFRTILDKDICGQKSFDDNSNQTDNKTQLLTHLSGDDNLIGTDCLKQAINGSNNDNYSDSHPNKESSIVSIDNRSEAEADSHFEDFNESDDASDEDIKQIESNTNSRNKKKNVVCDYFGCKLRFRSRYHLRVHISRKHTFERNFRCDLCSKSFIEKYELNTHKKKIHFNEMPLYRYQCHLCQYQTQTKERLKRHINRIHLTDEHKWICSHNGCHKSFKQKQDFDSHKSLHLIETEANDPTLPITDTNEYECHLCQLKTQNQSQLNQHIRDIHSDEDYKWFCSYDGCHKKYIRKYDLGQHIRKNHTDPKQLNFYDCPSCDYRTINKSRMNRHIVNVHSTDMNEVKKYICSHNGCDKRYKTKYDLSQHNIKIHSIADFNIKCDYEGCHKMFKDITIMRRHKRAVHSGRLFECDWPGCEAKFKTKFNYTDHKNIHLSDKQFECTFEGCSMKFTKKTNMFSHRAVHYKKFVCSWPECGQTFSANRLLKGHINMHQNSRQFKCTFGQCDKDFWTKNNLDQHIRKVHSKQIQIQRQLVSYN